MASSVMVHHLQSHVVLPPSLSYKQPPQHGLDKYRRKQVHSSSRKHYPTSCRGWDCNYRYELSCSVATGNYLHRVNNTDYSKTDTNSTVNEDDDSSVRMPRRQLVLFQTVVATMSFPSFALAANDAGEEFRLYSDESNKFKLMIPKDWEVGAGENNGVKSLTGFYPSEPSDSNVTVVITGLGADYTRLESFGKVDAFAENLVSGLDRSWQRPPGVAAKLIDSKASKGLYYIEYTLQKPGESRRHLYSVLGMANNGVYNRLYTVTGQFVDEDSEKYGSQIEKVVSSFRLT